MPRSAMAKRRNCAGGWMTEIINFRFFAPDSYFARAPARVILCTRMDIVSCDLHGHPKTAQRKGAGNF